MIAESVGKNGVNDAQDIESVLSRLVQLKVISSEEGEKNCPDDVAAYIYRYQGMISNRPGDGLIEPGKSTESNLIQGKVAKTSPSLDSPSGEREAKSKSSKEDLAYWEVLKKIPATKAGAEAILSWGDHKAAKAFADICRIKRWDLLFAIFQQQDPWDTDWMAREVIRHLSEQELAQLPKELRAKIRAEVGSGWVNSDEEVLIRKLDVVGKSSNSDQFSAGGLVSKSSERAGTKVDVEARALALEKATEYVDKNPGNTYAFSSPPSPPGGKVDCSGLMRAAIMAAGYPDPFFDPITNKQNPGVPMEDGSGTWSNGVALLVSHPNWVKKPLEQVISGDMVTFRTTRSDHKGEDGKYDHIGIVNTITLGADGNVERFTFVHSSSSNGPAHGEYVLAKPPSWLKASGAYAWDNPVK